MTVKRWIGGAADIFDVWTITVGGTWLAGETVSVTIANKTVIGTVGSTVTTTQVALLIKNMINSALTSLGTGESYTPAGTGTAGGGQSIPEFREITASSNVAVVTLTANTAGLPITISVSETSTSGTVTPSNATVATGKNFFDNADNWDTNSAPANGDVLIFDSGSVDCLYGLSTSLTTLTIKVLEGYTGKIGLAEVHGAEGAFASASTRYPEYRTKRLTITGATLVLIDNSQLRRCRIATGSSAAVVQVLKTGSRIDPQVPVVLLSGSHASNTLDITSGDVGLSFYSGETSQFPVIRMAYISSKIDDSKLAVGGDATLDEITKAGGTLVSYAAVPTLTHDPGVGPTTIWAGSMDELILNGGTLYWNSTGTLGTTSSRVGFDGHLNFDQDAQPKAIAANLELYGPNAKITDSRNAVTMMAFELREGAKPENVRQGPNMLHVTSAL